jgi:hypothetical protein
MKAKSLLIMVLCIIFFESFIMAQQNIILQVKSFEFTFNNEIDYEIPLSITNKRDSSILIPKHPNVFGKLGMSITEIGVEMFLNDTLPIRCSPSYQYWREPAITSLKPGDSSVINVRYIGSCFPRKGDYRIVFYFKDAISDDKNATYRLYPSNEIHIKML